MSKTSPKYSFLKRAFGPKAEIRKTCKKLKVRSDLDHKFLYSGPCRVIVRKKAYGDVILCGIPSTILISDLLLHELKAIGATGFEVIPAEVSLVFPHEKGDATFWQLLVTGWGGVAHPSSGIEKLDEQEFGKEKYSPCTDLSKILDVNQCDGSDFFLVWPLPYMAWVSPRIQKLFSNLKVKHCDLVPVEQYRFEGVKDDPVGFSPYPLECYMPVERAREVGEPLGIHWFSYAQPPYEPS